MIERQSSGGARQHAWDKMRGQDWESVEALAVECGCSRGGLNGYILALEKRDYIRRLDDGGIRLVRWTGPRAPSYGAADDSFRDWNLDPAMTGPALADLIRKSGLTHSSWMAAAGMQLTHSTRLRQMINGQRPVSPTYAAAAEKLAADKAA